MVEYTIGTVLVETLELATGVVLEEYTYGIVLVEYTTGTVPIECMTGTEVVEYTTGVVDLGVTEDTTEVNTGVVE